MPSRAWGTRSPLAVARALVLAGGRSLYSFQPDLIFLQPVQLSHPKTHLPGPRPTEGVSDPRLPGCCGHLAPSFRHLGKVTLPLAKVKLPPGQSTGQYWESKLCLGWGRGGWPPGAMAPKWALLNAGPFCSRPQGVLSTDCAPSRNVPTSCSWATPAPWHQHPRQRWTPLA